MNGVRCSVRARRNDVERSGEDLLHRPVAAVTATAGKTAGRLGAHAGVPLQVADRRLDLPELAQHLVPVEELAHEREPRLELDGRRLTVANLHATNNSDLARVEVGLAAHFVRDAETCILCGDFNVPAFAVPEFSPPIEGIDQILVRGLEFEQEPRPWPLERRRVQEGLLSDHAPVEAELTWT